MVDFDLDDCLRIVPNKYELILFAKTRAIELFMGATPSVKKFTNEKFHFTALKEVAEGFYDYNSLNEKTLTSIKNSIFGISVNHVNEKYSVDRFDETSLFAKNFDEVVSEEGGEDFGETMEGFENISDEVIEEIDAESEKDDVISENELF